MAARPAVPSKAERRSKLDQLLDRASLYSEFLGEQTAEDNPLAAGVRRNIQQVMRLAADIADPAIRANPIV